jgi:uncharacterized membrane protein YgcG
MRRHLWLGMLLALVIVMAGWGSAQAQDKSLYWQRYDVNINVQQNSDILVEEIQQIVFTSGTFRFGYRAIPLDRVQRITDVQVSEVINGVERPYTPGSSSQYGFTTATNQGNLEVTWYFPPTSNSSHTYIVRYRVIGGLRIYSGGDQLYWKAIGSDHNFPIRASKVTVTLPATFPQNQLVVASYGASATSSYTNQGLVVFEAQDIPADKELEVRVQFPHGVVQGSPPAWQAALDQQQQWGPILSVIFGGLGAVLLVGGPLAVYLLWYTRGRDRPVGMVAEYIAEPPGDLPAGVVGTLIDETADVKDIIASIVDLAHRGALRMEEEEKEGFLGIGSGRDFIFHLEDASKATRPYEKTLIKRIFGRHEERRLSDLRQKFYTAIPELREELYQEMVKEGFFPRAPQTTRRIWSGLGVAGLIVGVIIAFFLLTLLGKYSPWVACPGASLAVTMLGLMIVGRYMPRKTPKGAEEAAKWLAFKRYLQTIEKHSDLETVKDKFEQFLPYAVAFGLERNLINKFAAVDAPAPTWWGPVFVPGYGRGYGYGGGMAGQSVGKAGGPPGTLAGEGGKAPSLAGMSQGIGTSLASMSAGLGAMLSSAGTVLTSTPPSSSGSHGGWGGGGFSGGGFGGGGGGGGGSSGFG